MFATFKLLAVYLTLGPIAGLVGIPYTLMVGNITKLYTAAMRVVWLGVRAAGITIDLRGVEHLPANRSCIFMCNHVSNLDPPVLMPIIPGRISVLLKKELMSIPIVGTAMRMAQFVPVERGSRRDTAQATVAAAAKALADGLHILVYPEGTRSLDGRLSQFKKGPFFLAQQTGAPIIPVAISGTERLMRKGSARILPGRVSIQMLAAVEPGAYKSRDELMKAVHERMAEALPEAMKPHAIQPRESQTQRSASAI